MVARVTSSLYDNTPVKQNVSPVKQCGVIVDDSVVSIDEKKSLIAVDDDVVLDVVVVVVVG